METQKSCAGRKSCEMQKTRGHGRPARVDADFRLERRPHYLWGVSGCLKLPRAARMQMPLPLSVWIGEIRGLTNFFSTDCG
jgi:hypothetical protein